MDRFNKSAAGLLPCMFMNCYTAPKSQDDIHHESCPAHYRPAVAAALRQCDKEARGIELNRIQAIAAFYPELTKAGEQEKK